ncbi:MAG: SpoIIE family protein phosphatase [Fibrobacter sp.]|nr:SpoIIE family protein phosphatase [Fibrobacter sp.]
MIETTNDRLTDIKASIFHENEIRVNRLIGYVIFCLAILNLLSATLNYAGVFETDYQGLYKIYACISILLLAGIGIALLASRKFHFLTKIILLATLIAANTITAFYFFTYSRILFAIPIFLSVGYYQRKVSIYASVLVWIGLMYTAFYPGNSYLAQYSSTAILEEVIIPQTWVILLLMAIAVSFASSGKRQIQKQAQKTFELSAMESEIALSARIQGSVLPPAHYTSPDKAVEIKATIAPAKDVAGDFYDYFTLNNNNIAVLIADVSDKGLPAAMFMMRARETIRNLVHNSKSLLEAIEKTNLYLTKNNNGGMFVTAWIGILNTKTGIGKYINAGHLPPFVKRGNGSVEMLKNDPDIFMGSFEKAKYTSHLFELKKGDTLILYTDGATDAMNLQNEAFGTENLRRRIAMTQSSQDICEDISNEVIQYSTKNLFDDITILSLHSSIDYNPLILDIKANTTEKNTSEIIDRANIVLEKVNCPENTRKSIDIVIDEICDNIKEYAYGNTSGLMHVKCEIGANIAKLVFEDYGKAFDPLSESVTKKGSVLNVGGLGIHFVKNLSDEISYERIGDMNRLTVKIIWNT